MHGHHGGKGPRHVNMDPATFSGEKLAKDNFATKKRNLTDDADENRDKKAKYTIKYEPNRNMTKDELSEWRKQQRKERNRASAAASREKVRSRICELEDEVELLRSQYADALKKIQLLESAHGTYFPQEVSEGGPATIETSPQVTSQTPPAIPSQLTLSPSQLTLCHHEETKPHVIETTSRTA